MLQGRSPSRAAPLRGRYIVCQRQMAVSREKEAPIGNKPGEVAPSGNKMEKWRRLAWRRRRQRSNYHATNTMWPPLKYPSGAIWHGQCQKPSPIGATFFDLFGTFTQKTGRTIIIWPWWLQTFYVLRTSNIFNYLQCVKPNKSNCWYNCDNHCLF